MLLDPLSKIKGVGQIIEQNLISLIGGNKIFDLLLHKPSKIEKISIQPRLFEVKNDQLIIIKAKVESHHKPSKPRIPYKVTCYTPTGFVNLVFFKIFPYQINQMPVGKEIAILGVFQKKSDENQITHPEAILPINEIDSLPKIKITYPLKYPLSNKLLNSKIKQVLEKIIKKNLEQDPNKYEWIDKNLKNKKKWPNFLDSLKAIHFFEYESLISHHAALDANSRWNTSEARSHFDDKMNNSNNLSFYHDLFAKASERLAYDELLAWQLSFILAKKHKKNIKQTQEFTKNLTQRNLTQDFIKNLKFELTTAQTKAIAEIIAEINSSKKMLRLLQGDVGSGKTLVAISACLQAISLQKQCCVLCPTTVLTKQHFGYFKEFLANFSIKIDILTSSTTKKQKSNLVEKLQNKEIDILISTHAVLEDDVKFNDLGLAIIDEQHRFGVIQRLKLVNKGQNVDTLLMSATPIPRSLMMSFYGDMDITILNEKPKNRQEIATSIMSQAKSPEIYAAIKRNIAKGDKIYWICPAIDNQELKKPEDLFAPENQATEQIENELENVTNKYNELKKVIDEKYLGIIHGQMKEKQKDKIMQDFADCNGQAKLLIATTVIEVGIDVPDATIIIIENAERFGLAQLHQIRGRVGRSDKKSFCILLYGKKLGQNGVKRLYTLKNSNDGFYIAEQDLKMRGSGDLIGTKQSGLPNFKIADLEINYDLMDIAHKNAQKILQEDPDLSKPQSNKYRYLIKLFSYDECLNLVHSG